MKQLVKGLTEKRTPQGICVLTAHYSADPDRAKPEWKERERRKYTSGRSLTSSFARSLPRSGILHGNAWSMQYFPKLGILTALPGLLTSRGPWLNGLTQDAQRSHARTG
jgi:hypothetical protein